jgi:RNA polymerase sporulation-specific sigma factor
MSTSDEKGLPTPTSIAERRLIRAAKRGDRSAQAELLRRYEPLVRHIARALYLPGGETDDLAQCARLGIVDAMRAWDPKRGVPFRSFAWLCATREARMAVNSARAGKHQPLNSARPLHATDHDGLALEDTVEDTSRPDENPVAKAIAREQLQCIVDRASTLTTLERRALAMSANDCGHREIASTLGIRQRAVNNALQRARRKLLGGSRS